MNILTPLHLMIFLHQATCDEAFSEIARIDLWFTYREDLIREGLLTRNRQEMAVPYSQIMNPHNDVGPTPQGLDYLERLKKPHYKSDLTSN